MYAFSMVDFFDKKTVDDLIRDAYRNKLNNILENIYYKDRTKLVEEVEELKLYAEKHGIKDERVNRLVDEYDSLWFEENLETLHNSYNYITLEGFIYEAKRRKIDFDENQVRTNIVEMWKKDLENDMHTIEQFAKEGNLIAFNMYFDSIYKKYIYSGVDFPYDELSSLSKTLFGKIADDERTILDEEYERIGIYDLVSLFVRHIYHLKLSDRPIDNLDHIIKYINDHAKESRYDNLNYLKNANSCAEKVDISGLMENLSLFILYNGSKKVVLSTELLSKLFDKYKNSSIESFKREIDFSVNCTIFRYFYNRNRDIIRSAILNNVPPNIIKESIKTAENKLLFNMLSEIMDASVSEDPIFVVENRSKITLAESRRVGIDISHLINDTKVQTYLSALTHRLNLIDSFVKMGEIDRLENSIRIIQELYNEISKEEEKKV